MKFRRIALPLAASAGVLLSFAPAEAQMGPGMTGPGVPSSGGGGGGGQSAPTRSGPVQNRSVGPRSGASDGDDGEPASPLQRGEPVVQGPADPLAVSPELRARIGSSYDQGPPPPLGELHRSFFPYYEETRGDYRFRLLPPLYLEHTRGLPSATENANEPSHEDRESLYGLLYYQRRSPSVDADVLFPLAWRLRYDQSLTYVLGPLVHRTAPFEHDNWLAPLVFEGERKEGGYFHSPLLLTTTHWSRDSAFTLSALYFRDRTLSDIDWGVVPFFFQGDNGHADGSRRSYTLIPPLFYFHKETEIDESSITVVGPVIARSTPLRSIFDVAPLFFHIEGKPETGGVRESHTTLFPFFHYGYREDESLFVLPGYLRRTTASVDTLLTPFYSHATTRKGATSLTAIGPVLPLFWHYRDTDLGYHATAVLPFYYGADGPTGSDFLTPLYGHFVTTGKSTTTWAFPTLVHSEDQHGWETDFHPILYTGRSDDASHTVVAPIFWDFASKKGRSTVGFPLFWRFADTSDDSVVQVAGNTVYTQKRVTGGLDWQFHVVPFFSYGADPNGYFWNVLYGLAGYQREGSYARVRALWIPISVGGAQDPPTAPARAAFEK